MRSGRQSFKPSSGDRARMQQLPDSADDLPESVSVNLDSKDPEAFDIVEVDDTVDPADRGRPSNLDESLADQEMDLRGLSTRTQKRIDRLKFETHTERRAREQAERERDAAVIAARAKDDELVDLRRRVQTGTTALATSMKAERETKLADAQRRLTQAHEAGDSAAIAQATADMAIASAEITNIIARTPRAEDAPVERPATPQQPQNRLAPNVENWIGRNRGWFQQPGGEAKTAKAMSIHYDLLARGVQPSDPAYTRELDKGLKAVYPEHEPYDFSPSNGDDRGGQPTPRRTNAVAEGSRETPRANSNPRTVELTRSELSIAKRLGVTPQAYAVQKLKRMQANGDGA